MIGTSQKSLFSSASTGSLRALLPTLLVTLAMMLLGLFAVVTVLPAWQLQQALTIEATAVAAAVADAQQEAIGEQAMLQSQAARLEESLAGMGSKFLAADQAADLLNRIYQEAAAASVEVVELQNNTGHATEADAPVEVQVFHFRITGEARDLLEFVANLRAVSLPAVQVTNLDMKQGDDVATLTMDVHLSVSPYAVAGSLDEIIEAQSTSQ